MANPVRQLINRWRFGAGLPEDWSTARKQLNSRLRDLERTLGVLHGAIEYPTASYPTRTVSTADTTINSTTYVDLTGASASTFVLDADSSIWMEMFFYVQCTTFGAAADNFIGSLAVNGASFGALATTGFSAVNDYRVVSRVVQGPFKSGTSLQLKLMAKISGTSVYNATAGCALHYIIIPNAYKVP